MALNWNKTKYRGETIPLESVSPGDPVDLENLENRVFLDLTAVAPAPSRDYFRLHVTKNTATLTHWKISHGARSGTANETKVNLRKFSPRDHSGFIAEVTRVFGPTYVDYIANISQGNYDWIITLPTMILVKIFAYVGIDHLPILASTCHRFHQISQSEQLWEKFYRQHRSVRDVDLRTRIQAKHFSWKNLFLVHRVQDLAFGGKRMHLGIIVPPKALEPKLQKVKLVTVEGDNSDIVVNSSVKLNKDSQKPPQRVKSNMRIRSKDSVLPVEPQLPKGKKKESPISLLRKTTNMMEGDFSVSKSASLSQQAEFENLSMRELNNILKKREIRPRSRPGSKNVNRGRYTEP